MRWRPAGSPEASPSGCASPFARAGWTRGSESSLATASTDSGRGLPTRSSSSNPRRRTAVELGGVRTVLFVPLRKEDTLLGCHCRSARR